jgi:hypothetical protein
MKKFYSLSFALVSLLVVSITNCSAQSVEKSNAVPTITIVSSDGIYGESVGALCFSVSISNPDIDTTFVDVAALLSSTGNLGSDFTLTPSTIKFAPNFTGSEYVCVSVVNDLLAEPIEKYDLKITNPSNGAILLDSLISFTIYDDDSVSTNNPCADLFFSEFVHSFTANDRAFEIYNPTGQVVNLSNYSIKIYYNGSTTPGNDVALSGFLNYADTYIISHTGSDSIVRALADTVSNQFYFNAGNVVALYNGNNLIDCYGILGVDPGNYWPVGGSSTSSSTLVRKTGIKQGENSWAISNGQWDIFPQGDYTHLGSHTINGCGFIVPPTITMYTADASFNEADGTLGISAKIYNPANFPITVDVVLGSLTTATINVDFQYTPTQLTFPANSSADQFISISMLDDLSIEPDEVVELRLQNATNGASILDSTWKLIIRNDDFTSVKSVSSNSNLQLLPNPVKDRLWVSMNTGIESYQISNLLGNTFIEVNDLSTSQLKINLEQLAAGIYFIRIKSKGEYITRRFVKE